MKQPAVVSIGLLVQTALAVNREAPKLRGLTSVAEALHGFTNSAANSEGDVVEPKIVGGVNASSGEFPFFVQGEGCGASLIAEDVVLTAGHCEPAFSSLSNVIVGNYLLDQVTDGAEERAIVSNMYVHPGFNTFDMKHDFMVFKIQPVTSSTLTPISLNADSSNPSDGLPLTVIGFGATFEGGTMVDQLQKVTVEALTNDACNALPAYSGQIDQSMFCAGLDAGGADSCQGDSGGPIFDSNQVLVGVVSWGNGCAEPGAPGVYARVSDGLEWIQQMVCQLSDTSPSFCDGLPPISVPTSAPVASYPTPAPGTDDFWGTGGTSPTAPGTDDIWGTDDTSPTAPGTDDIWGTDDTAPTPAPATDDWPWGVDDMPPTPAPGTDDASPPIGGADYTMPTPSPVGDDDWWPWDDAGLTGDDLTGDDQTDDGNMFGDFWHYFMGNGP